MAQPNMLGWFEIPVTNMERAMKFYEALFDVNLERHKMEALDMAWFPWDPSGYGSGGTLVHNEKHYRPSHDGVLVYFTAKSGDVSVELSKVKVLGGKVLQEKKSIGEHGFMGLFEDTEGNRIALHSMR